MGIIRIRDQKIKRFYFKALTKEEKERVYKITQGVNKGKSLAMFKEKTHKATLQMEDDRWYEIGVITVKDNIPICWRKEIDKAWITINVGAIISFKAEEGSFKNKEGEAIEKNPKIILDSVDLIENGPADKEPYIYNPTGGNSKGPEKSAEPYKKRDDTGISVGHSLNCGLVYVNHKIDKFKILDASKNAHAITVQLQKEYKEKFPTMNDYDLKAMVGHGVLNSFKIGGKYDVLVENAKFILDELVPEISEFIKSGGKEIEKEEDDPIESNPNEIDEDTCPF